MGDQRDGSAKIGRRRRATPALRPTTPGVGRVALRWDASGNVQAPGSGSTPSRAGWETPASWRAPSLMAGSARPAPRAVPPLTPVPLGRRCGDEKRLRDSAPTRPTTRSRPRSAGAGKTQRDALVPHRRPAPRPPSVRSPGPLARSRVFKPAIGIISDTLSAGPISYGRPGRAVTAGLILPRRAVRCRSRYLANRR